LNHALRRERKIVTDGGNAGMTAICDRLYTRHFTLRDVTHFHAAACFENLSVPWCLARRLRVVRSPLVSQMLPATENLDSSVLRINRASATKL